MTTTAWTDVTMTVGGVEYPVEEVAWVAESPQAEEARLGGSTGGTVTWFFTCTDEADQFLRRLARRCSVAVRNQRRHGQGRRRAARRRQRGRVQREALRFVREIHALNPWARRDGFSTRLAQDIVRSVQARRGGCDG